jgi:hypothetical protein
MKEETAVALLNIAKELAVSKNGGQRFGDMKEACEIVFEQYKAFMADAEPG